VAGFATYNIANPATLITSEKIGGVNSFDAKHLKSCIVKHKKRRNHMTTDQTNIRTPQQSPEPDPALKRLNVLVGKWDIKGRTLHSEEDNVSGWVVFEWMLGGFFLQARGEINLMDSKIQSVEILAYDPWSQTFPAYVYTTMGGTVFLYYWDVQENLVIHWTDDSKYTGRLSADGRVLTGGWRPLEGREENLGNSYDAVMTRVE
jgi:hypothetical protein